LRVSQFRRLDLPSGHHVDRRLFLRGAFVASLGGAALYTVGCGSGDGTNATTPQAIAGATTAPMGSASASAGSLKPVLLTSEFVMNQDNRFAVGILDRDGKLLKNAGVHARFFGIGTDGSAGTLRGEGDLRYTELNVKDAHAHDKTSGSGASEEDVGFYVANTPFDQAGKWGVEITATPHGGEQPATIQAPFTVLEKSGSPGIGTIPPASRNDTTATNFNGESLCTRDPICGLHDKVIGDVLGRGRPLVVQFSTPAFCQTRFCGPVLEVLLSQVARYQDRVDFVHIEVWQDFQLQKYRPAVQDWHLPGEPYTFFMGKDGNVVGKIEAVFSEEELTSTLDQLVKV